MEYESTGGIKPLAIDVPKATEAVALVHAGPGRTDVLLRSPRGYAPAMVVHDSARPDCLAVVEGSIRFEPRAAAHD